MKRFKESIKNYEKALENEVGIGGKEDIKYKAKFYKGIAHWKIGDFSMSILCLKEAVESKPDNPDAHNNLGLSYFEM